MVYIIELVTLTKTGRKKGRKKKGHSRGWIRPVYHNLLPWMVVVWVTVSQVSKSILRVE